jgi:gliding motility-associated-like protein
MMTNRKLILFFSLFFVFSWVKTIRAQGTAQPSLGIALSEYCVSNIGTTGSPQFDFNGNKSDWVELYSTFTSSVNMGAYYLSNDKNNLYKWKFPSNYVIGPNQYKILWLSGKNKVYSNGEVHTNFSIDQCKGQYLILSVGGAIRDSIYVQRTKEGHSRGRTTDYNTIGIPAWKVFTTPTFGIPNTGNSYISYSPQPIIKFGSQPLTTYTGTSAGGFFLTSPPDSANIFLENGVPYDTITNPCFRIYYTLDNGFSPVYPIPALPQINTTNTVKLVTTFINLTSPASLIRAITFPVSSFNPAAPSQCELDYLPSFCETNTYFTDQNYQTFSQDFGVVSISVEEADTNWFTGSGATKPVFHVEYFDKKQQVAEGLAQVNKPINESWFTKQKGFYMTIDDRRGFGCNFEGNIFNVDTLGTTSRTVFPTLHLKAGDYESNSPPILLPQATFAPKDWLGTGIRDVFLQSLAAKNNLNVSPLHIKPVIAFLNGKYQGVYDLREVYDRHYENYYNQQSIDSLDLMLFHGVDASVTYLEGLPSNFSGLSAFANSVYTLGISPQIGFSQGYNNLFSALDKASFIDYMILNSYAINGNLLKYDYNIAFARGRQINKPGNKWHYYLWNTPSIFNYTTISYPGGTVYANSTNVEPCFVHNYNSPSGITPYAGNGHGRILQNLMGTPNQLGTNRYAFQQEYKNRYQDLLNGPLKCENILKHFDYVKRLFFKEMAYHEDPAVAIPNPGPFISVPSHFDSTTTIMRRDLAKRCLEAFGQKFAICYKLLGPYPISVDVQPAGAGSVRLNSLFLDSYVWNGNYYATTLSFKAVPANDNYVFHHWEFKNHTPLNDAPLSVDSLQINFNQSEQVVAVFTDKKNAISMPSGFTPNGDGVNDVFQPVGSALFSKEFEMIVWNRWGQEVYRSTDSNSGWDGNFKGEPAITGVYAYIINYKNIYNESKLLKGNITLLR